MLKEISPLDAARNLTPWWFTRILDFDGIDIKPCEVIGHTLQGGPIAQSCEPELANYWIVYGHYKNGDVWNGVEDFEGFATKEGAENLRDKLFGGFSHLRGKRGKPVFETASPAPAP